MLNPETSRPADDRPPEAGAKKRGAANPARFATPDVRSAGANLAGTHEEGKGRRFAGVSPAVESMLRLDDLAATLACDRRTVERMRSAGKLPRPDLMLGVGARRSPRWLPATIRAWIGRGGDS